MGNLQKGDEERKGNCPTSNLYNPVNVLRFLSHDDDCSVLRYEIRETAKK